MNSKRMAKRHWKEDFEGGAGNGCLMHEDNDDVKYQVCHI
jgi:hypothetical protein